jgi:hypothetical protein
MTTRIIKTEVIETNGYYTMAVATLSNGKLMSTRASERGLAELYLENMVQPRRNTWLDELRKRVKTRGIG